MATEYEESLILQHMQRINDSSQIVDVLFNSNMTPEVKKHKVRLLIFINIGQDKLYIYLITSSVHILLDMYLWNVKK